MLQPQGYLGLEPARNFLFNEVLANSFIDSRAAWHGVAVWEVSRLPTEVTGHVIIRWPYSITI